MRALNETLEDLVKAQDQNTQAIQRAFSMVDVHQQILQRITRELVQLVAMTGSSGTGALKLRGDFSLDMTAYYQEYRDVAKNAGQDAADVACVIWSQGASPEEAVAKAQQEVASRSESDEQPPDLNYEVEYFGGNNGTNRTEQVASGTT